MCCFQFKTVFRTGYPYIFKEYYIPGVLRTDGSKSVCRLSSSTTCEMITGIKHQGAKLIQRQLMEKLHFYDYIYMEYSRAVHDTRFQDAIYSFYGSHSMS